MTRVRILKKDKEGVLLKCGPMTSRETWEEFNKNWTVDPKDKFYAIMNDSVEKEAEQVAEIVNEAVLAMMLGRGNNAGLKLQSYSMMAGSLEKFQELVPDATPADFLKLVNISLTKTENDMLKMGVGFTAPEDEIRFSGKQRRRNKFNLKKLEEERNAKPKENTDNDHYTIGDAIKAAEAKKKELM